MSAYTKLFQSIVTSTLWRESPETKVVWVTMMALADKHGIVEASVPGLAAMSHVSIEECVEALDLFMSPDKWSRTPDNEGRRIAPVDGGWELLNHEKYRLKMTEDERREYERLRKQRQRDRNRSVTERDSNGASQNVPDMSRTQRGLSPTTDQKGPKTPFVPHSEEDAKAEADSRKELFPENPPEPAPSKPPAAPPASTASPRASVHPRFPEFWDAYGYKVSKGDAEKAFVKAARIEDVDGIIAEARWHAQHADPDFRPHAATWLNDKRWLDDHAKILEKANRSNGAPKPAPKYSSDTGPKERALKEREKQLRDELPDDATAEAMRKELDKLKGRFPTSRT